MIYAAVPSEAVGIVRGAGMRSQCSHHVRVVPATQPKNTEGKFEYMYICIHIRMYMYVRIFTFKYLFLFFFPHAKISIRIQYVH